MTETPRLDPLLQARLEENDALLKALYRGEVDAVVSDTAVWLLRAQQAESALCASEARFRDLVEGSIQGVIVHRHFRPLFVNPAYATLFGYSLAEILAMDSTLELLAPHERVRLQAYHEACLRGATSPAYYECQGVRKDGVHIWLEIRVRLVDWDGAPATQAAVVDVTARKQAEEQVHRACEVLEQQVRERTAALEQTNMELRVEIAERRRAETTLAQRNQELMALYERVKRDRALKATLLKELTHRVRNNLAAVIGILEVERERAHLRTADEALAACAARLKAIAHAHDLLASGDFAPTDLRDFIGVVAGAILGQARTGVPHIDIVFEQAALKLPPKSFLALACITHELILNAVKHAFHGRAHGRIEIRAWEEGEQFVVEVRDDGIGFAAGAEVVGTGLGIIATLCGTDLRGDCRFLRDHGTIARIAFPKGMAAPGAAP
jgi:PAS domain S-box-containing protein